MKTIYSFIALIFLFTVGCAKQIPAEKSDLSSAKDKDLSLDSNSIVESNNQFALDLYNRLSKTNKNLFFSPLSISTALTMVYEGAKGETEKQMSHVLYLSLNRQILHSQYSELLNGLETRDTNSFKLNIANALWVQNGFECLPGYISTIKTIYNSELSYTNFISEPVKSCADINGWVHNKTNGKISEIITPGNLNNLTRLVLANAVYFKADWAKTFDRNLTKKDRFYTDINNSDSVLFMNNSSYYNYYENDILQAVEIPYINGQASMVILLPKKVDGLKDVEKELTLNNFREWSVALQPQNVKISIPKFTKESELDLVKTLSDMGMPDAFTLKANFSGISKVDKLLIKYVLHKALIEVNEETTEAVASTVDVISVSAGYRRDAEVKYFTANHPFIYFITSLNRKDILFMGKIDNI